MFKEIWICLSSLPADLVLIHALSSGAQLPAGYSIIHLARRTCSTHRVSVLAPIVQPKTVKRLDRYTLEISSENAWFKYPSRHSVRHTFLSVANVSSLAQGSRRRSLTSMSMVRLEELSTNSSVPTIRTTVGHVFRRWNSLSVGSPKSDRRCRWLAYFLREAPRTSSSKMVPLAFENGTIRRRMRWQSSAGKRHPRDDNISDDLKIERVDAGQDQRQGLPQPRCGL